jgi:serine/threonine protein kinase
VRTQPAPGQQYAPGPPSAPAGPPPAHYAYAAAPPTTRSIAVNKRAYMRLDLIGKGGTSRVYRVMSDKNEILAIKRVSLDKADSETVKGYMNEIALLKRLDGNPRIIKLYDSETRTSNGKGHLHMVMECGEIGGLSGMLLLPARTDGERRPRASAHGAAEEAAEPRLGRVLLGAGSIHACSQPGLPR